MFSTLFIEPLFNILFLLYGLLPGHDFGVAVIGLTLIVRFALWPLVTRQLHSQRAVQALAPEVARIKQEAGGDRQKETQLLMDLYKERGTNPFAPILPVLLQLPIFLALYWVFMDSVQPGKIAGLAYDFVENIPAVAHVIANPSAFSPTFLGLIDLTKPSVILALGAAVAQFYQSKQMQPKIHPGQPVDETQKLMRNMIYIFPIMTFFFGLYLPSALALYWIVTSLVAIFQYNIVLRRDASEMEEAAANASTKSAVATVKPVTTTAGAVTSVETMKDGTKITTRTLADNPKPKAAKRKKKAK